MEEATVKAVRKAFSERLGEELASRAATTTEADKVWAALTALRGDLEALSSEFGSGRISRGEWMAGREPLTARLVAAESELGHLQEQESSALLVGGLPEWDRKWAAAERDGLLGRQRALLSAALTGVVVAPVRVRGRNSFDLDRVDFQWRI